MFESESVHPEHNKEADNKEHSRSIQFIFCLISKNLSAVRPAVTSLECGLLPAQYFVSM